MLRIATAVADRQGNKPGVVVLNYLGDVLLKHFVSSGEASGKHLALLNSAGYWLHAPNAADEWGFMFNDASRSLAARCRRRGRRHNQWISWGAGTRASQNLVLGAKTRCLLHNRTHVTVDDIRAMALPVMRHRILVNYKAEAEGVTVEKVIAKLLETVKS